MANETFMALSRALTGQRKLDESIGAQHEAKLRSLYGGDFERLLDAYRKGGSEDDEDEILETLDGAPIFHIVAREIIRGWYTGQFQTPAGATEPPTSVTQYSQGLLWRVIKAHAPGFSTDDYGAWGDDP